MNTSKVTRFFKRIGTTASKHSPEILTGLGIAGMLTTTVLAVKATPKALDLIEEKKEELETDTLTGAEIVQTTWKCYIPATLSFTFSAACLIGASSVNAKRNAALATAYKLSETALSEYREKVVETIGEKREKDIRDEVNKEHVKKNPVGNTEVIITKKGDILCYDAISGRYFKSDKVAIDKAVNELNRQMNYENYVSLSDFYDAIGLSHTSNSDYLGWNLDDGLITVDYGWAGSEDDEPCMTIDYLVAPRYDFSKNW